MAAERGVRWPYVRAWPALEEQVEVLRLDVFLRPLKNRCGRSVGGCRISGRQIGKLFCWGHCVRRQDRLHTLPSLFVNFQAGEILLEKHFSQHNAGIYKYLHQGEGINAWCVNLWCSFIKKTHSLSFARGEQFPGGSQHVAKVNQLHPCWRFIAACQGASCSGWHQDTYILPQVSWPQDSLRLKLSLRCKPWD